MKTSTLRILNVVVVSSIVSTSLAFITGLAAVALGIPQAGDYIVDLYVIFLLIGVPLCLAWFRRLDYRARLTPLEREILDSVAMHFPQAERDIWDQQVQAISKVERVASGDKVKFHLGGTGRNPYFPLPLLDNRNDLPVAVLNLASLRAGVVVGATVWCDRGRLSAIVYEGDVSSLAAIMSTTSQTDVVVTTAINGIGSSTLNGARRNF